MAQELTITCGILLAAADQKHKQRGIQPGFNEIIPIRSQHFPPEATPIYYFDSETFLL